MLSLVTAPATNPLTLAEIKAHCYVDVDDDNALLSALNTAATEHAENFTHRGLITQTWDLSLDDLSCEIWLPKPPLQITTPPVVTYVDQNGVTQTLSASLYEVKAPAGKFASRGCIRKAYNQTYPVVRCQADAVTVRFFSGYGAAAAVPEMIKAGIKILVKTWYGPCRDGVNIGNIVTVIPMTVDALLWPYKAF